MANGHLTEESHDHLGKGSRTYIVPKLSNVPRDDELLIRLIWIAQEEDPIRIDYRIARNQTKLSETKNLP